MFYYFLIFMSLSLLFIHSNSLMLVFTLLWMVLILLYLLLMNNLISSLLSLMIVIIYLGAMMILISYICAVCPNMKFIYVKSYFKVVLLSVIISMLLMSIDWSQTSVTTNLTMYLFFTEMAFNFLMFLMLLMFLILLSVTSQYVVPQGPFRSI